MAFLPLQPQWLSLLTAAILTFMLALSCQAVSVGQCTVTNTNEGERIDILLNSSSLAEPAAEACFEAESTSILSSDSVSMATLFLAGVLTKSASRLFRKEQLLWVNAL